MAAPAASSVENQMPNRNAQRPSLTLAVAPEPPRAVAGLPVLARLPNISLNAAKAATALPAADTGRPLQRWINQAWAQRLLVGGGVLLFIVALLPLMGRRAKTEAENTPSTAWQPVPSSIPAVPTIGPESLNAASSPKPAATGPQLTLPKEPAESRREPTSTDAAWAGAGYRTNPNTPVALDRPAARPATSPAAPLVDRRMEPPAGPAAVPPGMARLEGVIESPAVRTTYDPSQFPR